MLMALIRMDMLQSYITSRIRIIPIIQWLHGAHWVVEEKAIHRSDSPSPLPRAMTAPCILGLRRQIEGNPSAAAAVFRLQYARAKPIRSTQCPALSTREPATILAAIQGSAGLIRSLEAVVEL